MTSLGWFIVGIMVGIGVLTLVLTFLAARAADASGWGTSETESEGKSPTYCPKCGEQSYWFGCFNCHLLWGGGEPEDAWDYGATLKERETDADQT